VLAVALPEEMPVNETIDLRAGLHSDMGMDIHTTVVNAVLPDRFEDTEAKRLASLDGRLSDAARGAVMSALSEHGRASEQREQIERLRREGGGPLVSLPFLFEPDLGPAEVKQLSERLEAEL